MSLEEHIAKLTAAVEKQNGLLEKMMAGAPATTKAADKPAATTKAADKAADKPAATTKAAAPAAKKGMTPEEAAVVVSNYLKVPDADLKEERKGHVKRIIDHYGADRFTNIAPESLKEAVGYLKQFEAGEDPFAEEDGAGDEDGDDDSMV